MGLFDFNKESEKEVSSGALIGYVLVSLAVVLILAFGIFVAVKKFSNKDTVDTTVTVEQSIDTQTENASDN